MSSGREDLKAARDALCARVTELARESKSLAQCADALKIVHEVYVSERMIDDEINDRADKGADRGTPQTRPGSNGIGTNGVH